MKQNMIYEKEYNNDLPKTLSADKSVRNHQTGTGTGPNTGNAIPTPMSNVSQKNLIAMPDLSVPLNESSARFSAEEIKIMNLKLDMNNAMNKGGRS